MARTFYHDFKRDDGSEVTVEYGYRGGSPTTYSPHSGADGGDGAEVEIVKAFDDGGDVKLTDAECERAEAAIFETHVDDDFDFDDGGWL